MEHDLNIAPPEARPNKYYAIARTIKNRIMSGEITHRLPSVPMMAKEFSVTPVTMQKALDLLKEDGCVIAIPGKGSFITRLKRPRAHTIGAVISSLGPLGTTLAQGIQDASREFGQSLLIENYGPQSPHTLPRIQKLIEREQVDGFILWPDEDLSETAETIKVLDDAKIPYVITPLLEFQQFTNSTTVTNADGAPTSDVMTHLIGTGHKKIGYVTSESALDSHYSTRRYQQYERSMKVSGLKPMSPILVSDAHVDEAPQDVVAVLKKLDAVFCVTDRVALSIVRACLRNKIGVPEDLAIASFDNTVVAQELGITSVEQHFERIGAHAVKLLLDEIEGHRSSPVHEVIEAELIIRPSTRLA
ncbi:GntR family transcriptional regulator [Rubellicoccus peritrichatus]|uniref:GntR family transcriptional regulator n=1 Tax=Rubellicoccus peritrichatus TaxID=3080537 RepID=A0AAQ3L8B0_9BACT|nr:GntR family transcriptional regulator [Puniceicoccus sp. CR14]WOO39774.1 GntR family transcriptional regulator [Puniceicoccus sp. CR14]